MRMPEWPQRSGFHRSTGGRRRSSISFCKLGEADPLKVDRRAAALGHGTAMQSIRIASRPLAQGRSTAADGDLSEPQSSPAPASASGARSRPRWSMTAGGSSPMFITRPTMCPEGAIKVVADLEDADCAEDDLRRRGRAARRCGCWSTMPRASRGTGSASSIRREFAAHMAVNVRAPALLIERFAGAARRRATMRWSSTCSIPSSPRPIPIISAILCPSRRSPA